MDPESFEKMKDEVSNNLDILLTKIDICTEMGLIDEKSMMHNQAYTLQENIDEVETPLELSEIINKCKNIEVTTDRYLASKGETTIALTWPDVEE